VGGAAAGAIIGGAAALAVLPLVYWLVTKDTGANKVKKMFDGTGVQVTFLDPAQKNWLSVVEEAMNKTMSNEGAVVEAQKKAQKQVEEFIRRMQ
jgi:hypothetical protein